MRNLPTVYTASDVGKVRAVNEDSVTVTDKVYAIADGMGGHAAGEVASRALIDTVNSFFAGRGELDEHILAEAVTEANRKILAMVREEPQLNGMGTTATLLTLTNDRACWAHVGDSRLYLCRCGELKQITRDHSYVEELVAAGSITHEEARLHPRKNLLTRAVGVRPTVKTDTGHLPVDEHDIFLLCTDGLTNMVTDNDIRDILTAPTDADPARELVERALAAGGLDNVSAIVVITDGV